MAETKANNIDPNELLWLQDSVDRRTKWAVTSFASQIRDSQTRFLLGQALLLESRRIYENAQTDADENISEVGAWEKKASALIGATSRAATTHYHSGLTHKESLEDWK